MSFPLRPFFLLLSVLFSPMLHASAGALFTYDPLTYENLSVHLNGPGWHTRQLAVGDADFLKTLYQDEGVMRHFATGSTFTDNQMLDRISVFQGRSKTGIPATAWIVQDDACVPMGIWTSGPNAEAGVSELARMVHPDHQGKGLGTTILDALVKVWAPEVRHIGLHSDAPIQRKKFCCFGGEALRQLYVTSSPRNVPSWKTQVKVGFQPKPTQRADIDFKAETVKGYKTRAEEAEAYNALDEELTGLFDEDTFTRGTLYTMLDPQGEARTFSMSIDYGKIRYHFTYDVPGE